ncbi:uncharacterized protein LOC110253910 [Exaiptasia diaphana]|uniref:Mab-21-like HhH/H2TH-like domain-containing protein n=1 Tax=Exaiptasia diaphana TaxID=2652724 RepID=A0A913Y8I7_EXADI|nr:uncharacterized protein LOC110253910 [Exaiptasia diaphana]
MPDLNETEHWINDHDTMKEFENFVLNEQKDEPVVIFNEVLHAEGDPRYVKLKLTDDWKEFRPRFKDCTFLHQSYLFPGKGAIHETFLESMTKGDRARNENVTWTFDAHGPVRKLESEGDWVKFEEDRTDVFKFPQAWPEPAMEWLVRPRTGPWPSPGLVQEVFESGCHIAPVGRGKRDHEPVDMINYLKDPIQSTSGEQDASVMDQTEWRLSFSVAENKLAQSVTPIQRHVMILLKMIKKFYFPDVGISTYLLKNLMFWEIEKQNESFWKEDNSTKCLLHMLNRLQQCLEEGSLSHYILPESNLLAYEDPRKLAEAVHLIFDVRRTFLPKSISMLQRSFSLTYQSSTFHRRLFFEPFLDKLRDSTLPDCEIKEMVCSLLLVFASRAQDCVQSMLRLLQRSDATEDRIPGIRLTLHAYESLLARCLAKAWLVRHSVNVNEQKFIEFLKNECKSFSPSDEFMQVALAFHQHACEGKDLGNLVPYTRAMENVKEMCRLAEERSLEEGKMMQNIIGLNSSDFKEAGKIVKELMKGAKLDDVTTEDLNARLNDALMEIFFRNKSSSLTSE